MRSFAYRKGKSATMCLNEFLFHLTNLKMEKQTIFICVLDIKDAYNGVDLITLKNVLKL